MGTVVISSILRYRMESAQSYVDRTNQVLANSQNALISLLNAETGVRGYYISRQRVFLVPYELAVKNLEPTLTSLQQLVSARPSQLQQARRLGDIARDRMSILEQSIRRVEANEIAKSEVTNARLLNGKRAMDEFRNTVARFEAEERRLLGERTQSLQAEQVYYTNVMWCGIAISTIGTAIAIRILRQVSTELRDREVRLSESRNLIEAIVANVVDGVAIVNDRGKIQSFNKAAVEMFGYTPEEVVGWEWQQLLTPEAEATQKLLFNAPDVLERALPSGKIWQAMGQRKNGEWFPIEFSLNSISLDDDRIAIIRDITERQEAAAKLLATTDRAIELNQSLHETNRSLLATNQELDQFAYITAHDLKAPLRAIASLSEWIEEDLDDCLSEQTRSQMHLLRRRVYRMQSLLNSLLEYSRSGRSKAQIVTVDVNRLIVEIVQALAPPETFEVKILTPMPTFATGRQPLQQVFSHLIDNAIRHHPTKIGKVEISAADLGDRYEFTVADNGAGIEPQYQQRIYTIFQTLKSRDLEENIGAGLAIVKKIVIAEGGTIDLQSSLGNGAIFRFTWPKINNQ